MQGEFQHLRINKEPLINNRRTRKFNIPRANRVNLSEHAEYLSASLKEAVKTAKKQESHKPGYYVLKIKYMGHLDPAHLSKHGVEFLSQEDKQLCVAFADEQGLILFEDHLTKLGLLDKELTYSQILEAIDGIESWGAEDRKSRALKLHGFPSESKSLIDVELWPLLMANHPDRLKVKSGFENWLTSQQINAIDKINLDSLFMYRLEVSAAQLEKLLMHVDVRYVDLCPKSGITYPQLFSDIESLPDDIAHPDSNAAKICILDSGINTNHPLLSSAIADSRSFLTDDDPFDHYGHGTAVAGIALYGDMEAALSSSYWKPELWLLNGRILDGNGEFDVAIAEKTLFEAVTYFHEMYGCKIFNISVGDANSPYDSLHISGMAYVLDELARRYDLLFIVSAGNFSGSVDPEVPKQSWRDEYPDYLLATESIVIDPAPALNVITVGSLARHNSTFDEQRYPEISQLSPAAENQPSPFTRHGPSIKGAMKPDLVAIGGNLAAPIRAEGYQQPVMRGLGVLSCNHRFVGNTIFSEMSGTSFATPFVTHLAGRLLNNYPDASANLLRALLVNHADVPSEATTAFPEGIRQSYKKEKKRDLEREVVGYGVVNQENLFRSSEDAVVMMAEETIENNTHHFFELPFPQEFLRSQRAVREIRVTLSYMPAVRTTRIDYLATKLSYRLVKGESLEKVQFYFNHETQEDADPKQDCSTSNRDIGPSVRDKGTVQSAVWRLRQLNKKEKWYVVVTRQDREWGMPISANTEDYALVVTATDRENEEPQLYTNISQRLVEKQRNRSRTRT